MRKSTLMVLAIGLAASLWMFPALSQAQISTDDLSTVTAEDLVNTLLAGSGITASNVTYTGANSAAGKFTDVSSPPVTGIGSGIILSSGNIADVVGPNSLDYTTTQFDTPGDSDLNSLVPGYTTHDAAVLQFDIEPVCPMVTFRYVFTSEEYNEYTNSPFNNVFGWFFNGVNYALLPDGVTPVSINNVNGGHPDECSNGSDDDGDGLIDGADPDCTTPLDNIVGENNSNSQYYINNDCSDPDGGSPYLMDIEADGLTVVLTVEAPLIQGTTNHIKLAIADAGDWILDSWVFIETGSFKCLLDVDVKPGSYPNCFNSNEHGVIPVAILGSADFDVSIIDPFSVSMDGQEVRVKGKSGNYGSYEDVNGDGYTDLVVQIMDDGIYVPGDTVAIITASSYDGVSYTGQDSLCITQ